MILIYFFKTQTTFIDGLAFKKVELRYYDIKLIKIKESK